MKAKLTVSPEDIRLILNNKLQTKKYDVLDYSVEPLSEKLGLVCEHAILKISVKRKYTKITTDLTFFIKCFPKDFQPAQFARETGAFENEIFIYEDVFRKIRESGVTNIDACTPRCYLTKPEEILVFDNLLERNFRSINKHKPLDYDSVLVIITCLAKFHSGTLIHEEKAQRTIIDAYASKLKETFFNDADNFINKKGVEASIKCVLTEIDLFIHAQLLSSGKEFKAVAKETCNKIYNLVKPSNKYRNVVSHGDLWATNVLLKHDNKNKPIDCMFVDFQCARYVPPSQDLMAVLYLTTTRSFRKKHMHELIGLYHIALEKYLKDADLDINKILPYSDFMDSCEEQKLFAVVQTAIYFQLILIESNVLEDFFKDAETSTEAMSEDRSTLVLAHIHNEAYKKRLEESIIDLKDYCEFI